MKQVTFRPATREDAFYVADRLREADRAEVAALGFSPREAVEWSRQLSDFTWVGMIEGERAMLFGCGCRLTSETAEVWALGTDACTATPREMLFYGRKLLTYILDIYPSLENYCDARYAAAHRWLRKLGFTVGEPEPHGVKGEKFCKISISKGEH